MYVKFSKLFSLFCFVFRNRISLYSPGCPETHSVHQTGLELRNVPASASQVLGLKAWATNAQLSCSLKQHYSVVLGTFRVVQPISKTIPILQNSSWVYETTLFLYSLKVPSNYASVSISSTGTAYGWNYSVFYAVACLFNVVWLYIVPSHVTCPSF